MTGTFSINYKPVIILFDSGATHSSLVTNVLPEWDLTLVKLRGRT
jgi:hypothetical protein